jgi:hypothetical protein
MISVIHVAGGFVCARFQTLLRDDGWDEERFPSTMDTSGGQVGDLPYWQRMALLHMGGGQVGNLPHWLWDLYFYYEAFLVAGFVGFLVFVLFKVALFAVVEVVRVVALAFADALLVLLGLRIILGVVGLEGESADANAHHGGEDTVL